MFNNAPRGANMAEAILRLAETKKRTALSRSSMYAAIRRGEFPKQIQIGPRAVGWLESDIAEWIAACPKKSDAKAVQR
jgi:prophage regulatory protein